MKRTTILALVILGGATFAGLGVLFRSVFPSTFDLTGGTGTLAPLLAVSVAAALFVLGIFLGYLYSESIQSGRSKKGTVERFKKALIFERNERSRLGNELFEAKQIVVSLKDRLGKIEPAKKDDASPEREELLSKIDDLSVRSDKLEKDLDKRKHRIADLMAEVSIAQAEAEAEKAKAQRMKSSYQPGPVFSAPDEASLKDILNNIIGMDGVKIALVADDYGLVVASAGDGLPSDTLAAISTMVADFGPKVSDIIPMGDLTTISIGDSKGLVLETRYFDLYGARCALAIARDEDKPHTGLAEQAIRAIAVAFQE